MPFQWGFRMSIATSSRKKRVVLITALAGLASMAVWAAVSTKVLPGSSRTAEAPANQAASSDGSKGAATNRALDRRGSNVHVVLFREAPLASYRGGLPGIAAAPRLTAKGGRIDTKSAAARSYVAYLQGRQRQYADQIGKSLGRPVRIARSMQHAVNGFITELSPAEAAKVRKQPGVALVEAYREYAADTDAGPTLIGAANLWSGVPGLPAAQGEGMVVAVLDTGINWGSPSFAATGADGYTAVNPNGSGNYLGTCAPGGPDEGRCNDKLIGGYDFVCDYRDANNNILAQACGVANLREEPGFGDTNSHGSHTASTAAGNFRDVVVKGVAKRISGVAPHANIIAIDIAYTNTTTGQGSAPNVSIIGAIDQVIADGQADVINYSFSGGASPWSESVSVALLNAVDAGVYVAASAGNSGPGPGTLGHNEPWVASTAAAQHGRGGFDFFLSVSGPGTVPASLQAVFLQAGSGGVDPSASIPASTPVRLIAGTDANAGIDGTSDGCAAYPAGTFDGAIAVIRRGTCSFTIKANNAAAAGAIATVIANNQAGLIIPSVPGTTIPVFMVTQADANTIRDFVVANPTATAAIPFPAFVSSNVPDALGSFSSRGPATFDVLKPDLTAPGVSILAVVAGTTLTGFENAVGLMNGTSMSSPHHAGAAALVRQLRPTWTVPEVKSALMLTAHQGVLLEDQVTPANAFGQGAGRVQVDRAVNAGLVMNETKARYLAADPATGGDPSALNQPSMAKSRCITSCSFTRVVRSTLKYKQMWKASLTGVSGTVSPSSFLLMPGQSRVITVTVSTAGQPADGSWAFGQLDLVPTAIGNPRQPRLHMPIAVSVPAPPVPPVQLQNGVPVANLSGATGSSVIYALQVPAGQTSLTFTTQGGTGDLDLYVRRGAEPSPTQYDCASGTATSSETCTINSPQADTWYVLLHGYAAYSGVTLTGTYQ
jgi:hypothetical protein